MASPDEGEHTHGMEQSFHLVTLQMAHLLPAVASGLVKEVERGQHGFIDMGSGHYLGTGLLGLFLLFLLLLLLCSSSFLGFQFLHQGNNNQ